MSVGNLLLLLETLKAQSSKTTVSIGHLLLLLLGTLKAQSLGRLLLLLKSRAPGHKGERLASPPAKDKELHDTTRKSPPPPPTQDLNLHPSIEQPELLPNTDRETHMPLPSTQHPILRLLRIVCLVPFFVSEQKVQNINKNACRQMFKALEPFKKEVVVDESSKDNATAVLKFFSCHKKYQHQEPLKDLGIPGMTIDEFWEDGDKDYIEFEYGELLFTKQVHAKLMWSLRRLLE
jgi:hypothetical protein